MKTAESKTMLHPETGATLYRARRIEMVCYLGVSMPVEIEGWFPEDDGDGILTGSDSEPLDDAMITVKKSANHSDS